MAASPNVNYEEEIAPSDSVSQVSGSSRITLSTTALPKTPPKTKAPPKSRSRIWPYFEICLWDKQKPVKAKCIYDNCEREFYCKNGSTGSMGKHLKQDHCFDSDYFPSQTFKSNPVSNNYI